MTPAFPENGPGCKPVFDDVELLLMDKNTPPDALLKHIEEFGKEFQDGSWQRGVGDKDDFLQVPWPKVGGDSELDKLCSKESLVSWDFNLFKLRELGNGNPLAVIAYAILQSHDLVNKLKMDDTVLKRYLYALETSYNQCLYHNPMHAADVMHATNYFLQGDLAAAIAPEELLITLLSGPVHDLGHPGVNNMLLIKQQHPVAVKYDNKSVLENHHAWIALELLKQPGMDVLGCFPEAKQEELRKLMLDIVLYTDMTKHGGLVETLQAAKEKGLDIKDSNDRRLILQTIVHSADLSNPCKTWKIHIQWTHAILAEFFSQGDLERHLGLDVTPMLDRSISCGRTSQKNFFAGFVRPLYVICVDALPMSKELFASCLTQLDANIARWTELGF